MEKQLYNSAKKLLQEVEAFYVRMPEMIPKVEALNIPLDDPYWKAMDELRATIDKYEKAKNQLAENPNKISRRII